MLTVNELFAGIGAFHKALDRVGIPFKIVGISEVDKHAIASYNALYGDTRNYGDISKVKKLDYADMWTYGFPCQDISVAGQQRGIVRRETRSGLLYEVQRLLAQAALDDELPKYLIMENVKNLVSKKFKADFEGWLSWLDGIGYKSYWRVTNAADFDIPQKRERVMVISVRKDIAEQINFSFPSPIEQTKTFADLLEDNSDEKYFLSDEAYEYYIGHSESCKERGLGFRFSPVKRESCKIARTLTTRQDRTEANYIDERL